MALASIWFSVLLLMGGLMAIRLVCRRRRLPAPPLRLPLMAALAWALVASLPPGSFIGPPQGLWLSLTDDLLVAFATIRLVLWLALELPGGLGWWRRPPDLLLQLLGFGGSALAAVVILRQGARLDVLSLVTTSAVITAMVGLASQEALKDLISGLELQLSEDFRLGDWIELPGGQQGIVTSISWRDCSLRTLDDCLLVVPNSMITAQVLNNRSHFGHCAQRISVGLDYDFPPARALALLTAVVTAHPDVLRDPAPRVRLVRFDDSAITYELLVWNVAAGVSQLELRSDLLTQIWYALRREGQTIPFPVRQVEPRRATPVADLDTPLSLERGQELLAGGLFANLSDPQRRRLLESSPSPCFGPGEVIVREGAEGESLYVVLRGQVEVSKALDGRSKVVARLGPGEVFGEMTLFLDAPRSATVRALEECRLLRVGRPAVGALLADDPALLERLATLVTARRAELEQLSQEEAHAQKPGLLQTMKGLFAALAGP
ncbi:MAG: mechanosensitive ion channel family protein [Cyanobacteriota bacterium]|nr:mechanosensitive ion channel family protein [Cyanobacteriota bacterium]